ncbi:hypothetical protein WJX82_011267 [Trebouxia sp. C0006]
MSKKRFRPLGDIIRMGLIDDGALLRYVYKDHLMAVGRARQTGIEVPGLGILSAGKFEEHAGSKLHRPNQHTLAPSGKSLQDIMADSFEDGAGTSLHHSPAKPVPTVPLMDDPNDDFCRVCGYGGDMLCCETCPATFHMECVGLTALPDGDWWCPQCVCAVCGQAHFESRPLPATAKQVIWIEAEDTVASSTASASNTRPMLHLPKPPAPATLSPKQDANPAPTTETISVNNTVHPNAAGTSAATTSEQPDSIPSSNPQSNLVGADHTTAPFAATAVGNSANVVGRDNVPKGKDLGVIGEASGNLSETPGLLSGVPASAAPLQRALDSSTHAASTAMGLPVSASWQGKARLDQAAGSGSREGKKNHGELAAQTGPVSPGGSLGSRVQGKKRKVPEATRLSDTVPGPLGKKTKSNASDLSPAVCGPRSATADASSAYERLQRIAASAASPQAVQEALTTAFPPSQGSAKRAEKLKQFFSDVMPAGSGFKDRAAALTALASHFWQARNNAVPSGFHPNAPGRAVPNSPKPAIQSNTWLDSNQPQEVAQRPVSISMSAQSSGLGDVVASSGQSADDTAPQQRSTAVHVVASSGHGRKHHFSCLSAQQQLQVVSDEEVWFSSPQHRQLSAELAGVCCRGALPCAQVDESTPVTWQLIRGAAVADPQSCRGYAPKYSASQKGHLRQVLFAARHILLDCCGRLDDSRTGEDAISWMLQGRCIGNRLLDFSGFHVAVLWVAGVMASVALVRAFGPELAEVPLLATRHELQGNALAPLLLHQVEHTLLQTGVSRIIMPALPLPEGPSPEAPLPGQAALPVTPSGLKPWGSLVGYAMPSPAQLLEACRTSMLQLPGTPYLIKQLSTGNIVKVKPFTQGLRLNPEADAETLAHSGLLIPYAPESMVKPEPILDPEPHLNPEVTKELSDSVQALPAPPKADVSLERQSTGINGVTFSAGLAAAVGVDGCMTKQPAEAAGLTSTDELANMVEEDADRQGKASADGQGLPLESEGPIVMVTAGDQSGPGKRHLQETYSGSTSAADADGIRGAKRRKPVPHSSTTDTKPPSGSAAIAALSGVHDSIGGDDTNRASARATVSRKSPSPVLTTKDGSPSSAASMRSIATPSRVKIPKQQPTMPLT